ncbi:MAG: xanthine dehydrogenase subunit XdhB [Eubacteriales bacterium]
MFDIDKYYEAKTLEDALLYLKANPDAKVIAGGTDVLLRIREGKLAEAHLMGISFIDALKGVSIDKKGDLHIGPMMTFTAIEENETILKYIPILAEAVGSIGGPQIRNVATVGGNVCNGATSADSASSLFCLNAMLKIQTADETKMVPITEFYLGPGRVILEPGEMLTDIIIEKKDYDGYVGTYKKFAQRGAMDIATIGCAVVLKHDGKMIEDIRIGCGVAAPTPIRCTDAENIGRGMAISEQNIDAMAKATISNIRARDSWRGSKTFREHLVYELTKRGTKKLVGLPEEE